MFYTWKQLSKWRRKKVIIRSVLNGLSIKQAYSFTFLQSEWLFASFKRCPRHWTKDNWNTAFCRFRLFTFSFGSQISNLTGFIRISRFDSILFYHFHLINFYIQWKNTRKIFNWKCFAKMVAHNGWMIHGVWCIADSCFICAFVLFVLCLVIFFFHHNFR